MSARGLPADRRDPSSQNRTLNIWTTSAAETLPGALFSVWVSPSAAARTVRTAARTGWRKGETGGHQLGKGFSGCPTRTLPT